MSNTLEIETKKSSFDIDTLNQIFDKLLYD